MKWQRSATNLKISRVLASLVFLALLKLAVFGMLSVDSVTLKVMETVMPDDVAVAAETGTQSTTPIADKADSEANRATARETEADKQAEAVRTEQDMPSEWKALKRKEEELAVKERTLREMEASIKAEALRVEKMHAEMRQMLDEAKEIKDKRVKQLVDMISNTKAKKAAEILQTMETELAVKVLSGMRGRQAGEILTFVEAKKAAELSERLTKLQIPFMDGNQ
ncbi:MotE family protein [Pseudodesulfovibrio cashew]|nr:magnesium transporter MgtE [Pseudodesulfovibrio cashew]